MKHLIGFAIVGLLIFGGSIIIAQDDPGDCPPWALSDDGICTDQLSGGIPFFLEVEDEDCWSSTPDYFLALLLENGIDPCELPPDEDAIETSDVVPQQETIAVVVQSEPTGSVELSHYHSAVFGSDHNPFAGFGQ